MNKLLFALLAFLPSIILTIINLIPGANTTHLSPALISVLQVVSVVSLAASFFSGFGLLNGMIKNEVIFLLIGTLLGVLIVLINLFVVLSIACSHMGHI